MNVTGIHHVTAITSSAEKNYEFFTHTLGMRLVKKTVNQDDIQTYHLFFADDKGSPGTDMTFFDFPGIPKGRHGTDEIYRTFFRVATDAALDYWMKRFNRLGVQHEGVQEQFGKQILPFIDFDEQQYALVSDEGHNGVAGGIPWEKGPIPLEYAIIGLGPIHIRVQDFAYFKQLMEKVMHFTEIQSDGKFHLFETGEGGNGAQVIVEENAALAPHRQGYGTVHHAAFRVDDKAALTAWDEHIRSFGLQTSGFVERFFFGSLYVGVAPQILFEFATDGPGFMGDEPYETLGETLSLPPFLENKRTEIEAAVRPIDTVRSTKEYKKEYE